jgi:hypothetical protein
VITTRFRRPLVALAVTAGLLGGLSACGSDDSSSSSGASASTPASGAPASSAPAAKPLSFSLVEGLTAPRFTKDPNCTYGQWDENSTGVDEQFRPKSTFFRQFDCYKSKDDVGGIPLRLQQSMYVEFSDAATAKAYAEDQSTLYKTLLDDTKVVVTGTGLETVDMSAYLADIKTACGCGTDVGQ